MLFRLVRPVKRSGSRNRQFVRRIPSDVKSKATGLRLSIPVGEQTQAIVISPRAQSVRLSLRTNEPGEVKSRLAAVDAYLENVWRALREDAPVSLTHRQATGLAGELYRAWANGEGRERTIAIVHTPGVGWEREYNTHVSDAEWEAVLENWEKVGATSEPGDLEKPLGAIVDRLLLTKGIGRVDAPTRRIILPAFGKRYGTSSKAVSGMQKAITPSMPSPSDSPNGSHRESQGPPQRSPQKSLSRV
jgi:hypothetical protein